MARRTEKKTIYLTLSPSALTFHSLLPPSLHTLHTRAHTHYTHRELFHSSLSFLAPSIGDKIDAMRSIQNTAFPGGENLLPDGQLPP